MVVVDREITQRELRNDSGRIMRGLDEGRSFVVTRNHVPVGELAPIRRRRFVATDRAIEIFLAAAPVDLDRLRVDLDDVAGQDPDPRA